MKSLLITFACLLLVHPTWADPEVEVLYDGSDGLKNPFGIAFDQQQRMIICEYLGGRLWRTTSDHRLERIAGTEAKGYAGDRGPLAEAIFNEGLRGVVAGVNPVMMKQGIEKAVSDVAVIQVPDEASGHPGS